MTKNIKILTIIFSVVLNIVFIGSYFYTRLSPLALTSHQANHSRFLYEKLNFDHHQLNRLKPLRNSFHAFVYEQGRKIKVMRLELISLISEKKPDGQAIEAKQKAIQALQRQMQAKVIDHLLEEGGILTPAQRQKFFGLIKDRIEKSSGARPLWMSKTKVSSSKEKRP
jgi:Spy/CpxP family protein refolding chaperone